MFIKQFIVMTLEPVSDDLTTEVGFCDDGLNENGFRMRFTSTRTFFGVDDERLQSELTRIGVTPKFLEIAVEYKGEGTHGTFGKISSSGMSTVQLFSRRRIEGILELLDINYVPGDRTYLRNLLNPEINPLILVDEDKCSSGKISLILASSTSVQNGLTTQTTFTPPSNVKKRSCSIM